MDEKTKGAWILHHTEKLETVVNRHDFDSILIAGKSGILLSALAQSRQVTVSGNRVEQLAKAANISPKMELPTLLAHLESSRLIQRSGDDVAVLGVSAVDALRHTAALYDALNPSAAETASLALAELTSGSPVQISTAAEELADVHRMPRSSILDLIARSEEVGFIEGEEIDRQTRLIFNGNLFRRDNAQKMNRVLESLNASDRARVTEVINELKTCGCLDDTSIRQKIGEATFSKLHAIGVFDVNTVTNTTESVSYVTLPAAFAKFGDPFADDALDLAKAFVTCLFYGMSRSAQSRGRISMLPALLRKLISGGEVGPASAIGEDYQALELKGVISVRVDQGRFFMSLLKKDVGELALAVLTVGDASRETLPSFPGAAISKYIRPEPTRRRERKRLTQDSPTATRDILVNLRSGRR